jgi:hypothetical protein
LADTRNRAAICFTATCRSNRSAACIRTSFSACPPPRVQAATIGVAHHPGIRPDRQPPAATRRTDLDTYSPRAFGLSSALRVILTNRVLVMR